MRGFFLKGAKPHHCTKHLDPREHWHRQPVDEIVNNARGRVDRLEHGRIQPGARAAWLNNSKYTKKCYFERRQVGRNPVTYSSEISAKRRVSIFKSQLSSAVRFRKPPSHSGFTLIELMIVVAIIAIILTLALPVYTNYSIRAKIGEAISVAAAAKTAVTGTCMEDPTRTGLSNGAAGYSFNDSTWVESITVSEDCAEPLITIVTRNTGAPEPPPEITLTGTFSGSGIINWTCASPNAPNYLMPSTCRSGS